MSAEDEIHKSLLALVESKLERGVEFFLVAKSGVRNRAECLSAGASGTVRGQHLHMTGQLGNLAKAFIQGAGTLLLRALKSGSLLQQIRATGITYKKEVTAEHGDWLVRSAAVIGDEKNHVLRCVPRRVDGL